jgi:cytochrome c551/c552
LFDDIFSMARLQEGAPGEYHTAGLAMNTGEDCKRKVKALAVGFKKDQWYLGHTEIEFKESGTEVKLNIKAVSKAEKDLALKDLEQFAKRGGNFNSIKKDLDYQMKFYTHYQKGMKDKRKNDLLDNLEYVGNIFCYSRSKEHIYPDSAGFDTSVGYRDGKTIFRENSCASCHGVDKKLVAPALRDIRKRRPIGWLVKYIRNNEKMMKMGDPVAKQLYSEWSGTPMTLHPKLSPTDIKRIIYYLDHATAEPEGLHVKKKVIPN